jgi:hypothetical protein
MDRSTKNFVKEDLTIAFESFSEEIQNHVMERGRINYEGEYYGKEARTELEYQLQRMKECIWRK